MLPVMIWIISVSILIGEITTVSEPFHDTGERFGHPLDPDEVAQSDTIQERPIDTDMYDPILNENNEVQANVIMGDIAVVEKPRVRSATQNEYSKWKDGKVPYIISGSFTQQDRLVIAKAMKEYRTKTCIEFVPRITQRDYIYITKGSGCYSQVGRTGGKQDLSLGHGCVHTGIVIHELMHALGFWHEQSRPDRDGFVEIQWSNIIPQNQFNFKKVDESQVIQLNIGYDTCSVMHYGAYAFAIDQRYPTIVKKVGQCKLGQRDGFSELDVQKINALYGCNKHKEGKPDKTRRCKDKHKDCKAWSDLGECKKNPSWMLPNCPLSCLNCGRGKANCQDFNEHCQRWAELGECKTNEAYMGVYCTKSCFCSDDNCADHSEHCQYWAKNEYCKNKYYLDYMNLKCRKACNLCP